MHMRRREVLRLGAGLLGAGWPARGQAGEPGVAIVVYDPVFLEHRAGGHPERPERPGPAAGPPREGGDARDAPSPTNRHPSLSG